MFKKFEVAIHNKDVRRLVKIGEKHKNLSDDWGDTHFIEVSAQDEKDVRQKMDRRYPANLGYVIEAIRPL